MFKVNHVIIAGNLTRDIELRYTSSQRPYARFSVAVNRSVKQPDGSYKDVADFIPVQIWGKTAENCGRYLKKGDNVLIEGRISTRSYEANGEKKFVVEVQGDSVQFPPRQNPVVNPQYGNSYGNGYRKVTVTEHENFGTATDQKSNFAGGFPSDSQFDTKPLDLGDESPIPF